MRFNNRSRSRKSKRRNNRYFQESLVDRVVTEISNNLEDYGFEIKEHMTGEYVDFGSHDMHDVWIEGYLSIRSSVFTIEMKVTTSDLDTITLVSLKDIRIQDANDVRNIISEFLDEVQAYGAELVAQSGFHGRNL